MANCCWFEMKAVSDKREPLERLLKIMKYEDDEYFIYRTWVCDDGDSISEAPDGSGLLEVRYYGDVAWGPSPWVSDPEDLSNNSKTGAHYANLQAICKALNISVEVWAQEDGMGFQEHIYVDRHGNYTLDSRDISFKGSEDDPEVVGGFDEYNEFEDASEMWRCADE